MSETTRPSLSSRLRSRTAAVVIATILLGILLFVVVLPAACAIDPTGVGKALGLMPATRTTWTLGRHGEEIVTVVRRYVPHRSDTTTLTLRPEENGEVSLHMKEGDGLVFTWSTDRGSITFDMHAEDYLKRSFTSYWKGEDASASGSYLAQFDGSHGWHFKNHGKEAVTITLNTAGFYSDVHVQEPKALAK